MHMLIRSAILALLACTLPPLEAQTSARGLCVMLERTPLLIEKMYQTDAIHAQPDDSSQITVPTRPGMQTVKAAQ